jgi:hypothetical protein
MQGVAGAFGGYCYYRLTTPKALAGQQAPV